MSLVVTQEENFKELLRLFNTNIEGRRSILYALTAVKGVGRRFAGIVLKKSEIDQTKRAGELTEDQLNKIQDVIQSPEKYKIPSWFLNRRRDWKTGATEHLVANSVDMALRDDLERLKKIKSERGLRHMWGLRVRGQHTKTTGRRGKTVGVSTKKRG
ncbi:hypothetical protein FDP41_001660 [Naegleria fowleri]|uniref:40S ribosomal protein S18 n=1 Tax=Naegleria fowleri TaxID=5763 RepID=A0A6A5BQD1_NAEFO|nr:uncharacterized protein FDP41_001660 [Naegleria fowleri]KAF0979317.1 hypothetical protein FDP41_001660 [Naegleria fowleri]CAG4708838.1 unnamed protein product [Naegleria fowleri]